MRQMILRPHGGFAMDTDLTWLDYHKRARELISLVAHDCADRFPQCLPSVARKTNQNHSRRRRVTDKDQPTEIFVLG